MNLNNIKKNKVINNTIWMIGERLIQMFISLFIGSLTARYLGPENQGIINYAASYVAFFTAICTLGLDGVIVKELVVNKEKQGEIIGTGIAMRIVSSFISIIGIVAIVSILNPNDKIILMVVFLQSISLIFRSFELIDFWYQSMLKSKYTAIVKTISYIIISGYKIFLLITSKSVIWFAVASTLDIIIISVFLLISYYINKGQKLKYCNKLAKRMIKSSYHFILSGLMIAVYGQMDKIMLGKMLDLESVGIYSVGVTVTMLWMFIPYSVISSLRPVIMKYKNKDEILYLKTLKLLYCIIIWSSIIYSFLVAIFSKYIVFILYGKRYMEAVPVLKIMVWYIIFAMIGVAREIWLVCEEKQRYTKYFSIVGAMSNLILNIILIPKYGVIGAAYATLITQIITGVGITLIFKDTRINNKYLWDALIFRGFINKEIVSNIKAKII